MCVCVCVCVCVCLCVSVCVCVFVCVCVSISMYIHNIVSKSSCNKYEHLEIFFSFSPTHPLTHSPTHSITTVHYAGLPYPTDITRSVYERELAWANGYLPHTHSISH